MTSKYRDGEQLGLFPESPSTSVSSTLSATKPSGVVPFVDLATRAVREQAIKRVKSSGIFPLPEQNAAKR